MYERKVVVYMDHDKHLAIRTILLKEGKSLSKWFREQVDAYILQQEGK